MGQGHCVRSSLGSHVVLCISDLSSRGLDDFVWEGREGRRDAQGDKGSPHPGKESRRGALAGENSQRRGGGRREGGS